MNKMDYKATRRPYEFNSDAKDYHVFFSSYPQKSGFIINALFNDSEKLEARTRISPARKRRRDKTM